ncbi:cytochrome P450 [Saccharothrix xinjiangensis]|uniref:Cytochrome P450 n=1 Tax=Saccharothrix xinjiangensis TaxID=204798 RepID=A0ABV9YB23_9PSEU
MSTAPDDVETVDLVDPDTYLNRDMAAYWRALRAERPVHWHPPRGDVPGFWVVSRHADVLAVYRDDRNFTSERGNVLVTLLAGGDAAAGSMLAVTDGERHKDLRNVMLRAFSPRALARVAEGVRERARRLVAAAVEREEVDFATAVAAHVPMATISDLLGVPQEDRPHLFELSRSALSADEAGRSAEDQWSSRNEILAYFGDLVARRRAAPGDDVISSLVTADVGGAPLDDHDVVFNCYSLLLGGDETSRLTTSDLVHAFTRHPDQWARLRGGEVGLDTATEEVLRWATPAMHFGRAAVTATRVAGQDIAPGEVVTLWNASANRDERVFPDPDTFDLGRTPNKHVAFGYGPHFCLGAFLGRVEVREVLDALREQVRGIELVGEPRRIHSNLMTGLCSLPVRLLPA